MPASAWGHIIPSPVLHTHTFSVTPHVCSYHWMIGQVDLSSHPSKVYRMLSKVAAPPRDAKRKNVPINSNILDNLSLLLVHICSQCCQHLIESGKYLLLVSITCQPGVKATAVLPLNIFIHSIEVRKHSQWKLSISTATYLHAKSENANNAEKIQF